MIYSKLIQVWLFILPLVFGMEINSQVNVLPNAYAHNDYWHERPLFDAVEQGFSYVEADVYLVGGELVVAHMFPFFKQNRTLEALYLKPLLEYTTKNTNGSGIAITLMIDIKTEACRTYDVLLPLLQKYQSILSTRNDDKLTTGKVTIVITGHKPYRRLQDKGLQLAFLDANLQKMGVDSSSNISPVASCKYSDIISWKGQGKMPEKQRRKLTQLVAQAHKLGRKVRLWGSPENENVWGELLRCNVDLLNTDKLVALSNFLRSDLSVVMKQ